MYSICKYTSHTTQININKYMSLATVRLIYICMILALQVENALSISIKQK